MAAAGKISHDPWERVRHRAAESPGPARRAGGTRDLSGHRGASRLRSIWLRLLLPVAAASIGLIALGTVQAVSAAHLAADSARAATMAATATATVRLAYELETEIAEEDALRQRGGTAGASLVTAARDQTDRAVTEFRRAGEAARVDAPDLRRLLAEADAQVSRLPTVRATTDRLPADQLSAGTYEDLNRSLLAIADAVPELMTEVGLAANARAAAAIATAEHLAAQERDLLRGVFRRGAFVPGELATLASLSGAENERLAEFDQYATAAQRAEYTRLISGSDVREAARMSGDALKADQRPDALKTDPDSWYIAQSNTLRRMHLLEADLSRTLDNTAHADQAMAQTRAAVTGLSTLGLVVLAFGAALVLAIRTSRRLRALRNTAMTVAGVELPDTISAITEAVDPSSVRTAMDAAATRAASLVVSGSDEIGEVAAALTAVHHQAIHLAAEQASLRQDVAALFVALSRRGQSLIQRQLRLLDEFERSETDAQALHRLFELDHLAARMRRNEENLLVLAGGEPSRQVLAPVPLIELIQAAAAEVEDFDRVQAADVAEVGVAAHVVRDVIHLLAELFENATMFSPPTARVRVSARRSIDSVTISVFDEGIGMPRSQVLELNERLARPSMLTSQLAGTMGLLVVGRLAARHDITVELRSAVNGGTVALVALPSSLLTPAPAVTGHTNALLYPPDAIEATAARHQPISPIDYLVPAPFASPLPDEHSPAAPSSAGSVAADTRSAIGPAPLPRRRPGSLLSSDMASATELAAPPSAPQRATPDPDIIRARLSGLARGLAAADRRAQSVAGRPATDPSDTRETQDGN